MEKKMETTVMEYQQEKKMENGCWGYVGPGVSGSIRATINIRVSNRRFRVDMAISPNKGTPI